MRKPLSAVGLCLFMLVGCAPQEPAVAPLAAPPPAQPAQQPVASSPTPAETPKEAAKPVELTAEQGAKLYADCWAAFNAKDWAKFSGCFSDTATSEQVDMGPALSGKDVVDKGAKQFAAAFPDGTGEAQLTLVNGPNIAAVWLIKGTQKGPLATPTGEVPATNKKVGYLMGHVIELKGGKAQREQLYSDAHTMLGQLGLAPGPVRKVQETGAAEKPVVLATGNDAEKANVEVYKKYTEAFNKHDAAGVDALLSDDFVYSAQSAPADLVGKKEASRGMKEMWKGFSDAKVEAVSTWGAGDYVVSQGTFSGTNDGVVPSMKINKKTGKHVATGYLSVAKVEGGKLKKQWLFDNGMAFAAQLGMLPPPKDAKAKDKAAPGGIAGTEKPGAAKPGEAGKPAGNAATPGTPPGAAAAGKPTTPPGAAAAAGKPATPPAATPAKPAAPGGATPKSNAPTAPVGAAPAKPATPATPAAPATPAPAKPAAPAAPAKPAAPPAAK